MGWTLYLWWPVSWCWRYKKIDLINKHLKWKRLLINFLIFFLQNIYRLNHAHWQGHHKKINLRFHLRRWQNSMVDTNFNVMHKFLENKFVKAILISIKVWILHLRSCIGIGKEVIHSEAPNIIAELIFTGKSM